MEEGGEEGEVKRLGAEVGVEEEGETLGGVEEEEEEE